MKLSELLKIDSVMTSFLMMMNLIFKLLKFCKSKHRLNSPAGVVVGLVADCLKMID